MKPRYLIAHSPKKTIVYFLNTNAKPLLNSEYGCVITSHRKLSDSITHPCLNSNCDLTKLPLKSRNGRWLHTYENHGWRYMYLCTPYFNSSPPSAPYMRQWIGSALVQIMTCRLFGAKPSFKPMLGLVNWTLRNKLKWNFNQNTVNVSFKKLHLKISSTKRRPFYPGGDGLINVS